MKILALDTATTACSAALWLDGELHERFEVTRREHTALLLPMVEALLAEAGLGAKGVDAVAVGRGPGSFTGVRIAAGVAQGFALGAGVPVVPVSSLGALALGAARESGARGVLTAFDARMGEVYWGAWRLQEGGEERLESVVEEVVSPPDQVPLPPAGEPWLAAGEGWEAWGRELALRCHGLLMEMRLPHARPRAGDVARLAAPRLAAGEGVDPAEALPLYLRDRVVGGGR
ncbi:MAG TPA: tRNA (adenosine(37)-N6)-threonylcarbamoyltransferase complex dimerization subunit type 1 TsaB [Thiotrichales bacterium]|nr:tRNA (adenosine(37)-N6)-threonylcarbamoyltransferase complex dimerization subunit type 1 TsaB [Thiotrichales bacterium]